MPLATIDGICASRARRQALLRVEQRLDPLVAVEHQQHVLRQRKPGGHFPLQLRARGLCLQFGDARVDP